MLNSSLFERMLPRERRTPVVSSTTPSRMTSSSDARDAILVMPTLSFPRVVDVTTVDAIVALVTLVCMVESPSVSPRTALVDKPWSLLPWIGFRRMLSKFVIRFLELWVGAVNIEMLHSVRNTLDK